MAVVSFVGDRITDIFRLTMYCGALRQHGWILFYVTGRQHCCEDPKTLYFNQIDFGLTGYEPLQFWSR